MQTAVAHLHPPGCAKRRQSSCTARPSVRQALAATLEQLSFIPRDRAVRQSRSVLAWALYPDDGLTTMEQVSAAHVALSFSRSKGKDCIEVFDPAQIRTFGEVSHVKF
jgi:hypothetical protein